MKDSVEAGACVRAAKGKSMIISYVCWSISVNGWWQDNHEKANMKGKVNGCEAFDSFAMLGTIVLNVVHG